MRATPPLLRMSAGMRSSAMTATAPASSAMRACSAEVTSADARVKGRADFAPRPRPHLGVCGSRRAGAAGRTHDHPAWARSIGRKVRGEAPGTPSYSEDSRGRLRACALPLPHAPFSIWARPALTVNVAVSLLLCFLSLLMAVVDSMKNVTNSVAGSVIG